MQTKLLASAARQKGVPVIYANDNFGRWRSDFNAMVAELSAGKGHSARMVRLLKPQASDLTILKPRHSAFYGTPLDILLGEMGVRKLVIAGLATDICIQLSAADAFLRGMKVHAPQDCTAAESSTRKEAALVFMREILKCNTRPWKTIRWAKLSR